MMSLFNGLLRGLRVFRVARGGNVVVTFAIATIPIVGAVGAAVDYTRANSAKTALQAAADAAALSAASGNYTSDDQRVTVGTNSFNSNYIARYGAGTATVTVANNAVNVSATATVSTNVGSILGMSKINIAAIARAAIGNGSTACILALQTSGDAIFVHGNASLKTNCGIYSDSASNNGIDFDGDSVTNVSSACVVGNYDKDSKAKVTPTPNVKCPAMSDPLASLAVPTNAAANCDNNNFKLSGTGTLNPGVYCGGLELSSNAQATFNPGVYIIRDGQFKIGSSAHATGPNVMFYLTGQNANLDWGSSSYVNFTAPNSGIYKGIAFFQSRTANTSNSKFGGSATSIIQGAVYFPNGTVEISCNGTVMANADYTIWVVKRLQLDSNAALQVNSKYTGSATPVADSLSTMVYGKKVFLMN